jgi:hypothetical protein
VVPGEPIRLVNLCEEDRQGIANLVRQLAVLLKDKEDLQLKYQQEHDAHMGLVE